MRVGVRGVTSPLEQFAADMRLMRDQCAWKAAQTHDSLARHLLEETHETLEAIESGDTDHLREELGDLLAQIYFHAVVAEDAGTFTLDEVAQGIIDKMRRRNPHVFGWPDGTMGEARTPEEIEVVWNQVKAAEKSHRTTPADGIPTSLPALAYAANLVRRMPEVDLSTPDSDAVGDRLLALVAEAVGAGQDPERELRDAVRRLLAGDDAG